MFANKVWKTFVTGTRSRSQLQYVVRAMCSAQTPKFETLNVTRPRDMVIQVELNRPEKRNAMNQAFWREMVECFNYVAGDSECRAVVLTGAGKTFTAGLDLGDFASMDMMQSDAEVGRKAFKMRQAIHSLQESFTVIERCTKPVIAAMHGASVGAGIDMTSACDVRYCTSDAWFQIKEVDIGLAADVGTLQRFPKVVGNDSLVRELVYTARKFYADEALAIGYVSRIFPNKEVMVEGALDLAVLIASKSPIAVQGSKVSLVYSRDHGVTEGLEHIRVWNQGMLQSEDVIKSAMAAMQKQTPTFSKL
ncbi:delta(3,5)-Delta(2,4)-dienoyl-CoA isomerase, mitochondrial-like [Haliotis cracherodii]|uniref:delta(3,5)-Delta(2,4)-dienoyl-CoA isomerase, mitochondrial-like n=1 Tax=Haliotis cracherodii TaxID=6455 RepID=UPI0039E9CC95